MKWAGTVRRISAKQVAVAASALVVAALVMAVLVAGSRIYRPYVTLVGTRPRFFRDSGRQNHLILLISIGLKNLGSVPAYSFQAHSAVTVNKTALPYLKYSEHGKTDLFPKGVKTFTIIVDIDSQVAALKAGTATLELEMEATYRGVFWDRYRYTMVQTLDLATKRFIGSEKTEASKPL